MSYLLLKIVDITTSIAKTYVLNEPGSLVCVRSYSGTFEKNEFTAVTVFIM